MSYKSKLTCLSLYFFIFYTEVELDKVPNVAWIKKKTKTKKKPAFDTI